MSKYKVGHDFIDNANKFIADMQEKGFKVLQQSQCGGYYLIILSNEDETISNLFIIGHKVFELKPDVSMHSVYSVLFKDMYNPSENPDSILNVYELEDNKIYHSLEFLCIDYYNIDEQCSSGIFLFETWGEPYSMGLVNTQMQELFAKKFLEDKYGC